MTDPIELTYLLDLLPPGRIGFRRWRWELWHGPQLLAAGWRLSALHAQHALRAHASRYAHHLHGLLPLRPHAARAPETAWDGGAVAVECGELRVLLMPRALAGPSVAPAGTLSTSRGTPHRSGAADCSGPLW